MTGLTSPGSATWGARPAPVLRLVLGGFIYFVICHLRLLSTERRGCRWHRVGRRCRGPRRVGRVQRGGAQARGCHRWDATRGEVVGHAAPLAALGGPPHARPGGRGRRVVRPDGWKGRRSLCLPRLLQVPQPPPRLVLERAGCARLTPWTPQGSARQRRVLRARGPLSRLFFRSSCFLLNLVFTNKRKQHTTKQATK